MKGRSRHKGTPPAAGRQLGGRAVQAENQVPFFGAQDPMYIRPTGLFEQARTALFTEAKTAPGGVLIWGPKGMGKSSLARDIVSFLSASDPGMSAFPVV